MKKIKFECDIPFSPDGVTVIRGKAGESHDIPDDMLGSIRTLNVKKKGSAPENKAKK